VVIGAALSVKSGAAAAFTVTFTDAVLFAAFGYVSVHAVVKLLVRGPAAVGVTTTVTVTFAPGLIAPIVHTSVVAGGSVQVP
jgi:hypothetical protein